MQILSMYMFRKNCLKMGKEIVQEDKLVSQRSRECLQFENCNSCLVSNIMIGNKSWTYECDCITECQATIPVFADGAPTVKVKKVENTGKKERKKTSFSLFQRMLVWLQLQLKMNTILMNGDTQ